MSDDQKNANEENENNSHAYPEYLKNEAIEKNAEKQATDYKEKLWKLLDKEKQIELKHSNQRFELEIIAYKMIKNLHLTEGFEAQAGFLQSELTRISGKIKESREGLSVWEGGKLTFPKGFQMFFEFIAKASLSYITVSSISVILAPKDIITIQANDNVGTIVTDLSFAFWFAAFAGISLVELTAASVYNWFTSEPSDQKDNDETKGLYWKTSFDLKTNIKNFIYRLFIWIRPIHLLLLFILIIEGLMGASILLPILANAGKQPTGRQRLENIPKEIPHPEFWHVFLAVSVFALVNITFAVSKAKRDNAIVNKQNKLYKYLEHSERIRDEIKFCSQQAKNANEKFEKYFQKFEAMLDISQGKGLNWINKSTKN
jgi:hypothetical protein